MSQAWKRFSIVATREWNEPNRLEMELLVKGTVGDKILEDTTGLRHHCPGKILDSLPSL